MGKKQQEKKKPYSKEEYRKQKKKEDRKNLILMIIIGVIILAGVLAYYKIKAGLNDAILSGSGDAATFDADVMAAEKLTITGNFDNITMSAILNGDDSSVGAMLEEGALDPTLYIKAGDETVYSLSQSKDESDRMGCRVFELRNSSEEVIGYAAEMNEDGSFAFLDVDLNSTGYNCDRRGQWMTKDGEKVAESGYFPGTNNYYVIDSEYYSDSIPAIYKCFMVYMEYLAGYSYQSSGTMS